MKVINKNADVIALEQAIEVSTYTELLEKISRLSYDHPYNVLYFRGQSSDYRNQKDRSTIYPTIYRQVLDENARKEKFDLLEKCSDALIEISRKYKLQGISEMRRKKQIAWSILQHYEICDTPYLDITHSLRTACTFASESGKEYGYIYVLGMPYLTNRITYNSEEDILMVRLLSISPPDAKRPYYQEGFVAGTPDITYNYENKNELDFNSRLVGKFRFKNDDEFWGEDFSPLQQKYIYPENDVFLDIAEEVSKQVSRMFKSGTVGDFLQYWNVLETYIKSNIDVSMYSSFLNAMKMYKNYYSIDDSTYKDIDSLRKFRNRLVHDTNSVSENDLNFFYNNLLKTMAELSVNPSDNSELTQWTKIR